MTNEREYLISCLGCLMLLGISAIFGVTTSTNKKREIEAKRLMSMPDSYWEAEKEKAIASVKKHELDIQYKERMELDKRERKAKEAEAQREFEKSAPPEYWTSLAKQKEAEERGKTERQTAQARANAIENAARQIRYAM